MPRPILYVPPGGAVFELTSRTLQGRYLLRPSRRLNEILIGVLGRAQRLYKVELYAAAFLSNHFHLLVRVETPEQLSGFMRYFKGNLAKEVGRLCGWREKVWGRRYRPIQVSDEEKALTGRLRYLLSQACKEGLVASPLDWPGVNCARALVQGKELSGLWFDRTREFYARRKREEFGASEFAIEERVVFSPLPCWAHWSPEQVRTAVQRIVREIEIETAKLHDDAGSKPLTAIRVLQQNPSDRSAKSELSPAPRFHAATLKARRSMWAAYSAFYAAYREAARLLQQGRGPVEFPPGCFPPRLPMLSVAYRLVPG